MGTSPFFRMGRPGVPQKRAPASCTTLGGFISSPKAGSSVDSMQPLSIAWDPSCIDTNKADIYLYAPSMPNSKVHLFQNIDFKSGTYSAAIMPRWWNATSSIQLQLTIVAAGAPLFLTDLPAGPVFTATYTAPSSGTPPAADTSIKDNGVTNEGSLSGATQASNLSPGKIAAAVIMPILVVALAVAVYLKITRRRREEKSKRWSEALDKRMSTISTDWKSMSAAGANAAIRQSMAGSRTSFGFQVRPSDEYLPQVPQAHGQMRQVRPTSAFENRVSRVSFAADTRPSVDSARPRPSGDSRRTRGSTTSRAFHTGSIYDAYGNLVDPDVPPVPQRQTIYDSTPDRSSTISPSQAKGPLTLTPEAIRARVDSAATKDRVSRVSMGMAMDEMLPALSLMRTTNDSNQEDDQGQYLFTRPQDQSLPVLPTPTHARSLDTSITQPTSPTLFTSSPMSPNFPKTTRRTSTTNTFASSVNTLSPASASTTSPASAQNTGPIMGGGYFPTMPANMMSPDDMLRAYAARRATTLPASSAASTASASTPTTASSAAGGLSTAAISYPTPVASTATSFTSYNNPAITSPPSTSAFGGAITEEPVNMAGRGVAGMGTVGTNNGTNVVGAGVGRRLTLAPATPGAYSASRGAYGVQAYEEPSLAYQGQYQGHGQYQGQDEEAYGGYGYYDAQEQGQGQQAYGYGYGYGRAE